MKKILVFCLIFLLNISGTFANNTEKIKVSETNFSGNCYAYYSEIIAGKFQPAEFFKYTSQFHKPIFIQGEYLLPMQNFAVKSEKYNYTSDQIKNISALTDDNLNTFVEIDTSKQKSITLDFGNSISDKNIQLNFNNSKKFHGIEYQISTDGVKFIPIDEHDFSHYDFQYVRINFYRNVKTLQEEKIIIKELNFLNSQYTYIVQNYSNEKIKIYTNNKCNNGFSNIEYPKKFPSNAQTKEVTTNFEENPSLVANPESDSDNDGTLDKYDNCPIISNPNQQDSNSDGIGDLCADDDKDNIYGDKDNCIQVYNPDQRDINQNGIGDVCEFDADKDGIFDTIDNCINVANPNQTDSDKDNIGNACDNCSLYNPNQRDINQNGVGDYCEETEKNLAENDDDLDKIINYLDNCRYIANPDQSDIDKDNIGDVCDNCKNIQNKNQVDKNENGIGDMCEDSDQDGVEGYLDNCMHVSNSDQKDDDNNGVGNLCEDADYDRIVFIDDNCPFIYNPDQSDIDKDNIGDVCDESDERFIESNKIFFILLLLVIIGLFGFGIFSMMKKLK